jgi:FkbH-like protein
VLARSTVSAKIAEVLRNDRAAIAIALVDSVAGWEKYSAEITDDNSCHSFAQRETVAFVDYLISYFGTGDSIYRDLYIGEKLKQCYHEHDTPGAAIQRRRTIIAKDERALQSFVELALDQEACEVFAAELLFIRDVLTCAAEKQCRVLLIGDCLFLDMLGFLSVPLMKAGIQLVPTFITNKLVVGQHRELRALNTKPFDLIFYSPLSFAFHADFSELQFVRTAFRPTSYRKNLVDSAKRDIRSTIELLKSNFECPIFVHNSANLRRHDGTLFDFAKTVLTRRARAHAREDVNSWLAAYVEGFNSSARQLFLVDETAPLAAFSERVLSKTLYNGELQHPAFFCRVLSPTYEDIIVVQTALTKKKVIICDLDNTLWKGIIGEGAIEHLTDRQSILQSLRKKGMLLAISSKNDPQNVHWRGGTLSEDDFVCQQVNWNSKSENIQLIARKLNLKTKDFIFIDDRADERALVALSMPEITILDAEAVRTWSQLSLLATVLNESTDGDRTLAYKQREERERFLSEASESTGDDLKFDESQALKRLELKLELRFASQKELVRVAELINRTNQFNMNASRTNLPEVIRWHESDCYAIWIAEARDKFGSMGTVSVAVVEKTGRGVEIIVFVLSCRVFGYGMENALLNRIKRWLPNAPVIGHFKATPHNAPCHRTYPDNGFMMEGSEWVFRGEKSIPDVDWLTIKEAEVLASPGVRKMGRGILSIS